MSAQGSVLNTAFWLHFLLLVAGWIGPFVFPWQWMLVGYGIIFLQFIFIGRCVVNRMHELEDDNYYTFYTFLFEQIGVYPNRKFLFYFVRWPLYPLMSAFTLFWQVYLGFEPLLFKLM